MSDLRVYFCPALELFPSLAQSLCTTRELDVFLPFRGSLDTVVPLLDVAPMLGLAVDPDLQMSPISSVFADVATIASLTMERSGLQLVALRKVSKKKRKEKKRKEQER